MASLHGEWVVDNSLDPTETWASISPSGGHLQYIESPNIVRIEFDFEFVVDNTVPASTTLVTVPMPTPAQAGPINASVNFLLEQVAPSPDKSRFAKLEMSGSNLLIQAKSGPFSAGETWRVNTSFFYRTG